MHHLQLVPSGRPIVAASCSLPPPFFLFLHDVSSSRLPSTSSSCCSASFSFPVLACLGLGGVLRYKPFTGFLPVLPQYRTAPVQPLRQPDSFRLRQTESDWVRHLQTALRQSVQAFSSPVQAFSSCTALSTVLSAISGAYFLQYSTSWTFSLVPGTYRTPVPVVRDFVLLPVQYYRHPCQIEDYLI